MEIVSENSTNTIKYASVSRRFAAFIIDTIIIGVFINYMVHPLMEVLGIEQSVNLTVINGNKSFLGLVDYLKGPALLTEGIRFVITACYHAWFEANRNMGSPGKMVMGMIVTDTEGKKLNYTKAFLRNACKLFSNLIAFCGYLFALFTSKKQTLHDLIAGTVVIEKPTIEDTSA